MNDLPTSASSGDTNSVSSGASAQTDTNQSAGVSAAAPSGFSGSLTKEKEPIAGGITIEEAGVRGVGQEGELPKEVASAGVKIQPTTIPIPPKVAQMGVAPVGQNIPTTPTAGNVILPLTDDQIAQGLHQSVVSSWRWMAEWCVRKLKQLHIGLKTVHGKFMRVQV